MWSDSFRINILWSNSKSTDLGPSLYLQNFFLIVPNYQNEIHHSHGPPHTPGKWTAQEYTAGVKSPAPPWNSAQHTSLFEFLMPCHAKPYPGSRALPVYSAAGVGAVCQACLAMKMGAERFCPESTAERIFQQGQCWEKCERRLWTLLLSPWQKWQKWGLMITWNHNFLLPNVDNECAMYSQFL